MDLKNRFMANYTTADLCDTLNQINRDRQYPTEVVDAYGTNPREVFHDLSDLWEMEYTDPDTHEWNSFAGWSEYLMTDPDALRDQLDRAKERIKELETEIALLRGKANKTLLFPPNRADDTSLHRETQSASESL